MQKLFDSEIKVMEIVWDREPVSAKDISLIAADTVGWNKNTTYTIIKKLVTKGYICRTDPGFMCTALVTKSEAQSAETEGLISKFFNGSKKALFSALLRDEKLTADDLAELRSMIDKKQS